MRSKFRWFILSGMEAIVTYRRRSVSRKDVATIKKIIASHPEKSRRFISQEVCRQWDWRQANGVLKDMVCRSLLLLLESKGLIKLPPRKFTPANPLAKRKKPSKVTVDNTPLHGIAVRLSDLSSKQGKLCYSTPHRSGHSPVWHPAPHHMDSLCDYTPSCICLFRKRYKWWWFRIRWPTPSPDASFDNLAIL